MVAAGQRGAELDAIAREPDLPARRADAERIFAAIEKRPGATTSDARLLADHALTWAGLGFSARARTLFRRWRREPAPRDFARVTAQAEAIFLVCTDPAAASVAFRDLAVEDPKTAAFYVVSAVNRGELRPAIDVARRHRFFADDKDVFHACMYALWSLVLCGELDEARRVVDGERKVVWRTRHELPKVAQKPARGDTAIALARLRNEALVASYRCAYTEERRALEEALALIDESGKGIERGYVDLALATNEARSGDVALARKRMKVWRVGTSSDVALDRYRDLVRMDVALFEAKHDLAERLAKRVLVYAEHACSAVLTCHLRFCLVLAADAKHFGKALAAYRQDVHRLQVPHHLRRLRLIEALGAGPGVRSLRNVRIRVRTRHGVSEEPLSRLWTPTLDAVGSDLYWDRADEQLWLRGEGPWSLADQPTLRRVLEALLAAPAHAVPFAELFTEVWGGPYHPLTHDGKINVAVHRLRRWLDERDTGAARWIEVSGGVVRIARHVDPAIAEIATVRRVSRGTIEDRVMECLDSVEGRDSTGVAPADLQSRLGCSRASLVRALRLLASRKAITHEGAGRSLRYTRARPG